MKKLIVCIGVILFFIYIYSIKIKDTVDNNVYVVGDEIKINGLEILFVSTNYKHDINNEKTIEATFYIKNTSSKNHKISTKYFNCYSDDIMYNKIDASDKQFILSSNKKMHITISCLFPVNIDNLILEFVNYKNNKLYKFNLSK